MTRFLIKPFVAIATLAALSAPAFAEEPALWELKPDMGYAYDKDGKTHTYKMGTSNAGQLLKGAKKVPKGTLFLLATTASSICAPAPISRATASSCSDRIERMRFGRFTLPWRGRVDANEMSGGVGLVMCPLKQCPS